MDIIFYLFYLFSFTAAFVFLNYHILYYIDLKISSRVSRRLGINNEFSYLKMVVFKIIRDFGKKRYEYEKPFELIYYIFKPAVLLTNIIILLLIRSAINSNYSFLPVFLLLFFLSSFFIILDSLSSEKRENVFRTIFDEAVKLISMVPFFISVLTVYRLTGVADLGGILKIIENQTLLFRQPLGFILSLISIQIATGGILYRKPGFTAHNKVSESYITEFSNALIRFVITAFFAYFFLSGAKPFVYKMLIVPGEVVLIIKTYLLSFLITILKNSIPVIKLKVLFRVIVGVLIPLSILNFYISMVFL